MQSALTLAPNLAAAYCGRGRWARNRDGHARLSPRRHRPSAGESGVVLEPDWALQNPGRLFEVLKARSGGAAESGIDPADVIGIGIDFTACTMMPTSQLARPLRLPEYRDKPHAWVKLWKHHAAQPEADRINEIAEEMGEPWLDRYGGKISSEWFFRKALQILDEAPEVYDAADRLIEAADWVIWQLTGVETRNTCTAGYKAIWQKDEASRSGLFCRAASRLRQCCR